MDLDIVKRRVFSCFLITTIVVGVILALSGDGRFYVKAQSTVVSVLPLTAQVVPEQNVTVDVNITAVENLYGYELKIWYLNSVINTTAEDIVRPIGNFMEPVIAPNNSFVPVWQVNNMYNATHGRIWVAYTVLNPETGRTGSGILFRITFTGVAIGSTPVVLDCYPGHSGPVKLADGNANPIPHTVNDGLIKVIDPPVALTGDVNQNGIVNILDLMKVILALGSDPKMQSWNLACDLNGDNVINTLDLAIVAVNFGRRAQS